ncbi:MAG TPA: hypothetical protein VIY47_08120, partial [Ignavibacteriaceae bacterium]
TTIWPTAACTLGETPSHTGTKNLRRRKHQNKNLVIKYIGSENQSLIENSIGTTGELITLPKWATIQWNTGDIKKTQDFDLLYKLNYQDYLKTLRKYYKINEKRREDIVKKKSEEIYRVSKVIAIKDKEFPTVYSFIGYEFHGKKLMVHFCYTKQDFRGKGLIKQLLKLLEINKTKLSYSAFTSKPKSYSIFKEYKMENMQ